MKKMNKETMEDVLIRLYDARAKALEALKDARTTAFAQNDGLYLKPQMTAVLDKISKAEDALKNS